MTNILDRPRIIAVIGTRPEAIKMAPLILAIRADDRIDAILVATGQHGALLDQALAPFDLAPEERLPGLPPLALEDHCPAMAGQIRRHLLASPADLVLVQGDTTSALAAARAAFSLGIPVGHLEAGLRSHDLARPFPEEGHRIAIDRMSALLFAPTTGAIANLAADPAIAGRAMLTGNTGIDALTHVRGRGPVTRPDRSERSLLVTLHRREAIGEPLRGICDALNAIADRGDARLTLPLHPNPSVRGILRERLGGHPMITLIEPLGYVEMIAEMQRSNLILSDSGGIQEEAPALGIPLLILRDVTERPEAIDCGSARLATTDPAEILRQTRLLLDTPELLAAMARPRFPFGQGDASAKILTALNDFLGVGRRDFAALSR